MNSLFINDNIKLFSYLYITSVQSTVTVRVNMDDFSYAIHPSQGI